MYKLYANQWSEDDIDQQQTWEPFKFNRQNWWLAFQNVLIKIIIQ
jgi:hypothetical protein